VDTLTGFVPDWVKEKLGFKVDVQAASAGLEAVNSTITHSIEAAAAALRPKPETPYERAMREYEEGKGQKAVEAEQINVQKFEVPEPLTVHKPTQIDSSVTIQNLTIQSSGTPQDVQAALNRALAAHASNQRRAITSSLTD